MIFNKLLEFIEELGEHSKLEKDDFRKTHFIGCAHYKMGPSNEEAKKNIDEFKKSDGGILVTVNMADMGFDDRNLEVLVMARRIKTPVAYVQIRGRVLRKCDTNDPRNIKRQKGYAVLVDLARSAEEHEKKEIIEQVEEGGFSSQGVYADLAGVFEKEGVKEVEASVEVKPLRTFSVREGETENHFLEDEKKEVKQCVQLLSQLIQMYHLLDKRLGIFQNTFANMMTMVKYHPLERVRIRTSERAFNFVMTEIKRITEKNREM